MADEHTDIKTEVIVREGERLKLRTRVITIEVTAGPNKGQRVSLPGPAVRIGSGRNVDLTLVDPTVSRHHATLRVTSKGIRVIDEDSSNGTSVDGVRVLDAFARSDSVIQLGASAVRLRLLEDAVDLPLSSRESYGGLIGASAAMRQVFTLLELVADTADPVLIEGETGTGKELAAEALHEESSRGAGPFVVFDCSAVAPNLIESELFGHEKGAFTGAVGSREGAFEAAHGGTLFLDEIGELPLALQPKLLRALERFEVRRVGSNAPRRVNVRIVAATNRRLEEEVAQGRFREDLFYRLAVVRVSMPPLRERPSDVPVLVERFARELAAGRPGRVIPHELAAEFAQRSWPGNVRELRNAVARALSLRGASTNAPSRPPPAHPDLSQPLKAAKAALIENFERDYCAAALAQAGGNVTHAAELAGVNRKFIQRAIKRYGLRSSDE